MMITTTLLLEQLLAGVKLVLASLAAHIVLILNGLGPGLDIEPE